MPSALIVYVTCPDEAMAAQLARKMIEMRLAACGNVLPMGRSFFRWDGEIQEQAEYTVIFKSTQEAWPKLEAAITEAHPYDVPCILAVPIENGHAPFLQWIGEETSA